jgi:hypothetical protein
VTDSSGTRSSNERGKRKEEDKEDAMETIRDGNNNLYLEIGIEQLCTKGALSIQTF